MFRNQGTDYYGDMDELDPTLASKEDDAARQGGFGDWGGCWAGSQAAVGGP